MFVLPGNQGKEVVGLEGVGLFLSPVSGEAAVQGPANILFIFFTAGEFNME